MINMILYSTTLKASLSNKYNKLCSHHFKDPVRWGVNVTQKKALRPLSSLKDPVRWGVNVTLNQRRYTKMTFKDPVRWGVIVTVCTL